MPNKQVMGHFSEKMRNTHHFFFSDLDVCVFFCLSWAHTAWLPFILVKCSEPTSVLRGQSCESLVLTLFALTAGWAVRFSPFPAPSPSCSAPHSVVQSALAAPSTASSAVWWFAAGQHIFSQTCWPVTLHFWDRRSHGPRLAAVPPGAGEQKALHADGSPAMAVWAGQQYLQGSYSDAPRRCWGQKCLTFGDLPIEE